MLNDHAILLGEAFSAEEGQARRNKLVGLLTALYQAQETFKKTGKQLAVREQWFALHKYLAWLGIILGLYNVREGLSFWDPDSALSLA